MAGRGGTSAEVRLGRAPGLLAGVLEPQPHFRQPLRGGQRSTSTNAASPSSRKARKPTKATRKSTPPLNAFQLSQRYALERFCQAAASRGAVPPPYNGSIFTMDMPAGVMGFDAPKPRSSVAGWPRLGHALVHVAEHAPSLLVDAHARRLRHASLPGMQFVRDGLEIGRDRCQKLFGIGRRVHHGGQLVAQCRRVQLGRHAGAPALPSTRHHRTARHHGGNLRAHPRPRSSSTKSSCPAPTRASTTTPIASPSAMPTARC